MDFYFHLLALSAFFHANSSLSNLIPFVKDYFNPCVDAGWLSLGFGRVVWLLVFFSGADEVHTYLLPRS